MARFISIPVTSKDNHIIKADAIVTALRASSTTTNLIIQGGSGTVTAGYNLQLTHAADTATASVAKSIMDQVIASYDNKVSNKHSFVLTLPKAVSAIAFA
jgi:hypothetical protein